MTYTALVLVAVPVVVLVDLLVLRTRLVLTGTWWAAYAILCFFQLVSNGWLTGRGIVQYDPETIVGSSDVRLVGDGRLVYAPVEDLAFGFAMLLLTAAWWVWLGRRRPQPDDASPHDA